MKKNDDDDDKNNNAAGGYLHTMEETAGRTRQCGPALSFCTCGGGPCYPQPRMWDLSAAGWLLWAFLATQDSDTLGRDPQAGRKGAN